MRLAAAPGRHGQAVRAGLALGAVALLLLGIALAVSIGEMRVPAATVLRVVSNRMLGTAFEVSRIQDGVIWDYRLSRALFAAVLGAGLAMAGAVLQALLRNPLAEPYVLGLSAGASAGAVAVVVLGLGGTTVTLSGGAFGGALLALAAVAALGSVAGGGTDRILLAGVVVAQLFSAITAYVVATAADAEQARGVMFWLLGNLSGVRWDDLALAAPVVALAGLACLLQARALDAFTFGTDAAAALGVSVPAIRAVLFGVTAAMTAVLVSIAGTVGFVGLVVPHAARFLVGPCHVRLLPAAALLGAILAVMADILSRTLVPQQTLPIGVVTALFGAPAFAAILCRTRRAA
ncbi:FecCD family ABC transporter permease [Pseudoroseomonas globiformis]|uniref:FecCD family ABC transporter permease n=1 Tax=Teichococcus globiformis TaxID=2307229 RepID=A0ABV7G7Y6_9PROT